MPKIKIDRKIVGYRVESPDDKSGQKSGQKSGKESGQKGGQKSDGSAAKRLSSEGNVVRMHEKLERPEMLQGSTYKVKTPISDHAMYVTINDVILNPGTEYEQRRPFEIFINSKNLDHYQWIVALTRLMSAVFRKGGDVAFMVDELKAVFDPRGGYWQPGGKFMPSIIAELGHIVEKHLRFIGVLPADALDENKRKLVDQKRREYEDQQRQQDAFARSEYPAGAQLCSACSATAVVFMDGCMTCLSCGDSKCG
ncbi:MAG: NrdJb [Gammaproteobacteria bacterium]|nr:NrdJb [Gammaproteobacteria bacterium]